MWSLVQNILGPYQIYHLLHVTIKTYPYDNHVPSFLHFFTAECLLSGSHHEYI
jgi:hypothetical protein